MTHVNVGSPVGTYSVESDPFFRYVVRLCDAGLPLGLGPLEREALDVLGAIPDAAADEEELFGQGWRVVPATSAHDWPVLEISPERLRASLQIARRLLWEHASPVGISAPEIVNIEEELDKVLLVVDRAQVAGYDVNVSYVS